MSNEDKEKIDSLGLDEALDDLKFLAQKVSDMSKDLLKKAADHAEDATDKMGNVVESTGDILISAGETIRFRTDASHLLKNNGLEIAHGFMVNLL